MAAKQGAGVLFCLLNRTKCARKLLMAINYAWGSFGAGSVEIEMFKPHSIFGSYGFQ
jgi:hypothetical protein